MKKLRLLTKSLLFLSFFLPFVLVPKCEGFSAAERAKFVCDSLKKDSIIKDSLKQVKLYQDFLKKLKDTTDFEIIDTAQMPKNSSAITSDIVNQNLPKETRKFKINFSKIGESLIYPTDDSYSGFAVVIIFASIPFDKIKEFEIGSLLFLIFPLGFLIIIVSLIAFRKINLKKHLYLSLISFIFIFFLPYKGLLAGYYIALILNLLDIIVIYISIRKAKPKPLTT